MALTRQEVEALLSALDGVAWIMAVPALLASSTRRLPYGPGLRLMEFLQLRVKDIDFANVGVIARIGEPRSKPGGEKPS